MQHAVDPVADPDAVGERLDVDVGRPHRDGFLDDQVDQPDDRGVALLQGVGRRPAWPPVRRPRRSRSAVSVNSWSIESTDSVSEVEPP